MLNRLRRLWSDRRGNIALITALLLPVLLAGVGGAVDITNASMCQSALQDAADATAVSAVARYSPGYQYALTMTSDGAVPDTLTAANLQSVFNANWHGRSNTSTAVVSGGACGGGSFVCKQGPAVRAYVQAKATFQTSLLGMVRLPTIQLSANSQAADNVPTYMNYYIIVDISQSMGIASTPTDMANLYNRVYLYQNGSDGEKGCVFGCHVPAPNTTRGGVQSVTNEQLAHNISPKITLRVDSAVLAIQNIINQAQISAGSYQTITIGLYTMSADPVTGNLVNTIVAPSSNYTSLSTVASTIDLGNNNIYGYGDSDFVDQLAKFNTMLPANGTGQNVGSPVNYVFIVTDGLADSCQNSHCDSAFNASYCNPLKAKSTVGVIYTTYVPITNQNNAPTYNPAATAPEGNYSRLVAPYLTAIPTNLANCASSSNLYFQASQGPEIVTAMSQLFAQTQLAARITH